MRGGASAGVAGAAAPDETVAASRHPVLFTMSYRDRDYDDRDRGGSYDRRGGDDRGGAPSGPRDPPTGCSLLLRNLSFDTT